MMDSVPIANRGEVASRILRACRSLVLAPTAQVGAAALGIWSRVSRPLPQASSSHTPPVSRNSEHRNFQMHRTRSH